MNRRASVFSASSATGRLRSLSSASVIVASFLAQPGVLGSAACNGVAAMGSCVSQDASFAGAYSASSSYSHAISQADESASGSDPFFYDVILPALAGAPIGRRRSSTFTASTTASIYFASSSALAAPAVLQTNSLEPGAKRMRLRSSTLSSYRSMLLSARDATPESSTFGSPVMQSRSNPPSQWNPGATGTTRTVRIDEDAFAWDAANMQGRDDGRGDVEVQSVAGLSTQPSASTLASGISSQASAVVRPLPKRHRDSLTVTLMRARAKALRAIDPGAGASRDDSEKDVLNERAMQAFYTQQKLIDQGWAPAMARGIAGLIVEQGLAGRVAGDPMSYLARTPSTIDVESKVPIQRAETFSEVSHAAGEKGCGWGAKVGRMLTVTRKIVKKKSRLHVCEVFDRASG